MGDADNGGGYEFVGGEGKWEMSVPFSPFCYEPKTALKKYNIKERSHPLL